MHLDANDLQWVETTLGDMTLERKVGQILLPMLSEQSAAPLSPARWVEKYQFGGGHFFGGRAEDIRSFVDDVQAFAEVPLLITGDLDKGGGDRIAEGTLFQYQMALGAANDTELAYSLGKSIAVENLAVGYNWTFSPVVDIYAHHDYLRHIASVGEDVQQVIDMTSAQIRGIQDTGMAACAKHFPGDGFDDRDQHLTTSINPQQPEQWYRTSGRVFKGAIDAGVWTIMNSCIAAPMVDRDVTNQKFPEPVVISRHMTEDVLRGEFGFDGVIVSDALNMGGIAHHYPQPERYALAFEAGNDMLLFVTRIDQTVEYMLDCFKSGRISIERLDDSVRRILTLKARLGLHKKAMPVKKVTKDFYINSPCHNHAKRLAEKSITMLSDSGNIIPVNCDRAKKIAHVLFTSRPEEFTAGQFDKTLEDEGCKVQKFINPSPEPMYDEIADGDYDLVITSFCYPIQWGWNTMRGHGPSIRGVMSGYHLANKNTKSVFISFDTPVRLREMGFMDPFLCTYGECPAAQIAVAEMILGKKPITGRVPVSLDGFFTRGDGIQRSYS